MIFFLGCTKCTKLYTFTRLDLNEKWNVLLIIDNQTKLVHEVQLPIAYKVKNNCAIYQNLVSLNYLYKYSDSIRGGSPDFELIKNHNLRINTTGHDIELNKEDSIILSIRTKHRIRDWAYIQEVFKSDIETAKSDTITINDLKSFRNKYKKIYQSLIKGNQLRITYTNNEGTFSYYKDMLDVNLKTD